MRTVARAGGLVVAAGTAQLGLVLGNYYVNHGGQRKPEKWTRGVVPATSPAATSAVGWAGAASALPPQQPRSGAWRWRWGWGRGPPEASSGSTRKRIMILGDSLAVGVGCTGEKPTMPEAVAASLSRDVWGGAEVEWEVFGEIGSDVREFKDVVLPEIEREFQQRARDCRGAGGGPGEGAAGQGSGNGVSSPSKPGGDYDVVLICIGLNDIKRYMVPYFWTRKYSGTYPEQFGSELEELVGRVRDMTRRKDGVECRIVLPGLPYNQVPQFVEGPLGQVFPGVFDMWEVKKLEVSRRVTGVHYIEQPTTAMVLAELRERARRRVKEGKEKVKSKLAEGKAQVKDRFRGWRERQLSRLGFSFQRGSSEREPHATSDDDVTPTQAAEASQVRWPITDEEGLKMLRGADNIHPSDRGYEVWGSLIARQIALGLEAEARALTLPSAGG